MGSLVSRSSLVVPKEETKVKVKKERRKRWHQQLDKLIEPDAYIVQFGKETEEPNIEFMKKHERRDNKFDRQQQMMAMNDPPGAPRTYPSHYSSHQNNIMTQSWSSSSYDVNGSVHPMNLHRMTPPYNTSYDPNQHVHAKVSNMKNYQSQPVLLDEQLSKKVHFSSPSQQQTSTVKPLVNTISWHDSSVTTSDTSASAKPVQLSNRSSVPRSKAVMSNTSPPPSSVQKAIYVGIDHQATLAGRGETIAPKRHRKNGEKNHSDGLNPSTSNQRTRSRTNHQQKHQQSTDSPSSNSNVLPTKPAEPLQQKLSGTQRTKTKNKSTQNTEQIPFISNEIKPLKSKSNHRQQPLITNEIKPLKTRENHRQHHQHLPNASPLHTESSTRQIENKHSGTPVMRISLNQNNQRHHKQPKILPALSSTANTTQIRI